MRDYRGAFKNYFLFYLSAIALTCFQVSLWPKYAGNIPAPHFWIPVLTYWNLYRSPKEGLIMSYLLSLLLAPLTVIPLGMIMFINTIFVIVVLAFKNRFYQPGPIYFSMSVGLITFLFVPVRYMISFVLDNAHFTLQIHFFDWIFTTLLTTLAALPLYTIFMFFDALTQKELPTESGRPI